jgi:carbon-monoxide dehydrogenase large subunit
MTRIVGKPTPKVEGDEKVTGAGVFTVDVTLPRMLWGKVLRSPVPYARIKHIDVTEAARVPGVKTVITGQDVKDLRIGRRICDMPILAGEVVRFIGEKVAAVAAESEEACERALELIEVEYEEMDPLLDPVAAAQPTAPLLHPNVMSYSGLPAKLQAPSNVFVHLTWGKGDVRAGFQESDIVFENCFRTPFVHQGYLEPHACMVKTDSSGGADVWACSKTPYAVRDQLANAINIPKEKLVFHPTHIGGDFGGKGGFMDVPVCYFLSLKSGRPVKMVMDYDEELTAGNPRHASVVTVRTGVKKDGSILAHHMEFILDSGAYGAMKPRGYMIGVKACAGPYRIANCLIEQKLVYTNKLPCGHMRAPGEAQGFFATESQLDMLARRLGMEPSEFKRKNLLRDGDVSPIGHTVEHVRGVEALDRAIALSGYRRPKAKNVGRGLAFFDWSLGGGEGTVFVKIDEEGKVTVSSPVVEQGAGVFTVICEVVGEELQIPTGLIELRHLDSAAVPSDRGVGASRATRVYGNAAYDAGAKAKQEILTIAATHMEVDPRALTLANGFVSHRPTKRRIGFGELIKLKGSPIQTRGYYKQAEETHEAPIAAQVAEVRVDPETGRVCLNKFVSVHATGKVINPLMHQGQIDGGVVFGIGYALTEQLVIEGGKVATANLGEYKIPNIRDIPPLTTAVLDALPDGPGPYNSLSIGEAANVSVAAAVANAVYDAVGVRIKDLPITAEKVYAAMNRRGQGAI